MTVPSPTDTADALLMYRPGVPETDAEDRRVWNSPEKLNSVDAGGRFAAATRGTCR